MQSRVCYHSKNIRRKRRETVAEVEGGGGVSRIEERALFEWGVGAPVVDFALSIRWEAGGMKWFAKGIRKRRATTRTPAYFSSNFPHGWRKHQKIYSITRNVRRSRRWGTYTTYLIWRGLVGRLAGTEVDLPPSVALLTFIFKFNFD